MRLTDLVSGADLDLFATVSLWIFLAVFVAVVVRALLMSRPAASNAANIPLDDDTPIKPREARHG